MTGAGAGAGAGAGRKIITEYAWLEWIAFYDGDAEYQRYGFGDTPEKAIEDLKEEYGSGAGAGAGAGGKDAS